MHKRNVPMKSEPMNKYLMVATVLAGVALAPVVWWLQDPLVLSLAALLPFIHGLLRQPPEQ